MARAARALQQARHALRAAELEHLVDRREIHAEVEARRGDHAAHACRRASPARPRCAASASSEPWCSASVPGSSGHTADNARCHSSACERVLVNSRLVRARDRRLDHARAAAPGRGGRPTGSVRPRRAAAYPVVNARGGNAATPALHRAHRGSSTSRASSRLPSVADRPHVRSRGASARSARQGELQQHAALVAEQFVPFVDDDGAQRRRTAPRVSGYDSSSDSDSGVVTRASSWPARAQALVARARVARAQADAPVQAERVDRFAQRAHGVGRQRAQRRDPEQAQRARAFFLRGPVGAARVERIEQRSAERRERLAAAGRRVQQARFARQPARPDFALERQRRQPCARTTLQRRHATRLRSRSPCAPVIAPVPAACRARSASAAGLSCRQRRMRGKRTAMPDLWRVDAVHRLEARARTRARRRPSAPGPKRSSVFARIQRSSRRISSSSRPE